MQRSLCKTLLAVVAVLSLGTWTLGQTETNVHPGVTKPSEERSLSFSYPGVVREVLVKEGDRVKEGQPVMRLDDRLDRNQLKQAEIEANSSLKIEYAKKSLAQKVVQRDRLEGLRKEMAANPKEVEEAVLNVDLAVTQLKLEEETKAQAETKAAGLKIKVELAELASTIDGVVQKLSVKQGEYADPQQSQRAACVVVKNDPLKVEVFVPATAAGKLSLGQALKVAYLNEEKWHDAKITFFDPVADPGSGLRRLNLEMANPENRESGLQVNVKLP